ncbi:MAG TPA: GNAT family N-acetyltransferase [Chitinophagaceae bacterium]|nr:GNAT family N-acetyltransferase [Chitinophagaceae bacterium]
MKFTDDHKLDNPVWHSLNETHQGFSINYPNLKCYHPDICPFGGYETDTDISVYLDEYAKVNNDFFIVGSKPLYSPGLTLEKELVCLQMVLDNPVEMEITAEIRTLNNAFEEKLLQLVLLVQPGYFKPGTPRLGDYAGIFENGELVAVTGERMKMNAFTEISAIVTHPAHTGKGYAKQLIAFTVNKIFRENKTPYLHVAETNTGAVRLYEKLGFKTRRKISFWNFQALGK